MKMVSIVLSLLAVLLLFGSGLMAANAYGSNGNNSNWTTTTQQFSFSAAGGVLSLGNQFYVIQQSGPAEVMSLAGYSVNPNSVQFNYNLVAYVNGINVTGFASFHLSASLARGGYISVSGSAPIDGQMAALCLPSEMSGACLSSDTSSVPAFFISSNAYLTIATSIRHQASVQTLSIPMAFESAYMNPFGGPIVVASADFSTVVIVTTYNTGTISWSNVVTGGMIGGMYGTTPVSGFTTQVTSEQENLVTGNATDHGVMSFFNMVDGNGNPITALDASGTFRGTSSTPTSPSFDCSALIGFSPGSGLCTEYGYNSVGTFNLYGSNSVVSGSYSSVWPIPAFTFTSTGSATVTTTNSN